MLDEEAICQAVCDGCVAELGYRMAWIGLIQNSPPGIVRPAASSGHEAGYLDSIQVRHDDTPLGQGPTGTAIREGRPVTMQDLGTREYVLWRREALSRGYHASAAFPLRSSGGIIGTLNLYAGIQAAFGEEDLLLLDTLATQTATAIENARRVQVERHRREGAEMLRDLAVTVHSTLDVDQVLNIAVRRLQAVHQATACSVSFLEEGGETFVFRATTDPNIDLSEHITFPASQSIAGVAIRKHKVHIENQVDQSPGHRNEIARHSDLVGHSLLTAPLFSGDIPLGVIQVLSSSPDAFDEADADLLATTAALIETAVNRAQTYTQAVQLAQSEYRQREVAETLRRVATLINASLDLNTVLDRILEQLALVVNYDSASLLLEEEGKLATQAIRTLKGPGYVQHIVSNVKDNPLFQEMLVSRRPIVIPDVKADYRYQQWPGTAPVRSWIGVPIIVRDQVIGQLAVDKYQPDYYGGSDAELVFTFAQQAASAIENARLHQTLQDYASELETRVEARTAEVSREREQLLAVLESAGDSIAITDATGIIEYANPAWERLTGYNVTDAIQQQIHILDEETFPDLFTTVRESVQHQRVWRSEVVGQRPDGTNYVADLAVTPVFEDVAVGDSRLANLVALYRDVTQHKELDRIKSEFLSTASHELRSPLTSMLGFSELMLVREDLSAEEQKRFLKYIHDHAAHLKKLVDDLLDISRIESGVGLATKLEPLDLYPLIEKEIQLWQAENPNHKYQLIAGDDNSAGAAPNWPQVYVDQNQFHRVIRNLLSNATKYSPSGGKIGVRGAPMGGYLEVTVADEGIGIGDEELPYIFEKFWRADASSTAVEGTGLGLVIVKHIVEQHGGQIWAESTKGKQTVIHFTLPLVDRKTTVLVIEDEESVREIEHRILAGSGIATLLTDTGQQGIEMAETHRPDLILLDLMIPDMPGQEVLRSLKSNPSTQHIPVLVVSGRSSWQTIEESYMLGAIDFLAKPFELEELLGRVRRGLNAAVKRPHGRNNH